MHRSLLAWTTGSLLLASPVFAQDKTPATPSPAPSAPAPVPASVPANADTEPVDPRDKIVSEVKFENVSVEDVVQFLQDVAKDYRAVVVRKARNQEGPLVTMRLKNVSVQQVIEVIIAAHGGIDVTQVDGPGGPVDVIVIQPEQAPDAAGGLGAAAGPAEPERAVRVYRLAGIVEMMLQRPAPAGTARSEKESLDDVLSLVKATIELSGGREAPTMQVHAETQTLIFKGSPQQRQALEDVLASLESNRAVRGGGGDEAHPLDVGKLKKQLADTQARFEAVQQEAVVLRTELAATQRRSDSEIQELNAMRRNYQAELEKMRQHVLDLERSVEKPKP